MRNNDTANSSTAGSEEQTVWNRISGPDNIKSILRESAKKPQLIYKHSPRCSVSFLALEELEKVAEPLSRVAELYMVDVIHERSTSREIASTLGVRHESPQVILLKDGAVHWKGSHWQVKGAEILKELGSGKG